MERGLLKKRLAVCLMLAILAAFPAVARAEGAGRKLTLMIYMCGSNLESKYGSASADLQEMLEAQFDTRQINVIIMCGGSNSWAMNYSPDRATIMELGRPPMAEKNGLRPLQWATEAMDMGAPETLTWFIGNCEREYPAEEYALILWDHGGGPMEGVCWDEVFSGNNLTLSEMTQALEAAQMPKKLSWIGFDACLMSSVEVASQMSPYADYMVASQAEEPASGWNYAFLNQIETAADTQEVCRRIVDSYFAYPQKTACDLALASISLAAIGNVEQNMSQLFQRMSDRITPNTFSSIAKLRISATGFGKAPMDTVASAGYDLVDVASLCRCYASEDEESVQAVLDAIDQAVVYSRSNVADCGGLSAYHPFRNQKQFKEKWEKRYDALDFCEGYSAYIKAYGKIMSGEHLARWNALEDIQALEEGTLISLKLSEEQMKNLASARLVVLARNILDEEDRAYFRVYSSADVSIDGMVLSAAYDGTSMQIMDETGMETLTGAVSYRVTEDGLYQLPMYPIEEDGTRWTTPVIAEYERDDVGRFLLRGYSVFDEVTGAYSSRADIDLSTFSKIMFIKDYRLPTHNVAGEMLDFEQWKADDHQHAELKYVISRTAFMPSLAMELAFSEDLYAAYEIVDTQGNTYMSELVALSRENGDSVQYYTPEITLGDEVPMVNAALFTNWEERNIQLCLMVQNCSDRVQEYSVPTLVVNDKYKTDPREVIYNDNSEFAYSLAPGEFGYIWMWIDAETLGDQPAEGVLDALSGILEIVTVGEPSTTSLVQFFTEPGVTLDAIYHEDGAVMEKDESVLELPVWLLSDDADTSILARAILKPSVAHESSMILLNISLNNGGDSEMFFDIEDVKLNGVPIEDNQTPVLVLPGEMKTQNIILKYDDIALLQPDVSLQSISYQMNLADMNAANAVLMNRVPCNIHVSIPLDSFYEDTDVLPPQELVDMGREVGALDAQTAVRLFEDAACDVKLQGLYVVGRDLMMLLRIENGTERAMSVHLGHAQLDGRPVAMGIETSVWGQVRNNRAKAYFLDKPQWEMETSVNLILQPGEATYRYVKIVPDDVQTEVRRLSFQAYMYEHSNPLEYVYFDSCEIDPGEAIHLADDSMGLLTVEDMTVKPGRPAVQTEMSPLFKDEIIVPEGDMLRWSIPLQFEPEPGEKIEAVYYNVLRTVSSDAELASLNILNEIDPDTKAAEISFADGQQWLMYEALGLMEVSEDGRLATAVYPGLMPVVRACGESLPMMIAECIWEADGTLTFSQIGNHFSYYSTELNAVTPFAVGSIAITCDPASGRAEATDYKTHELMSDLFRGLIYHNVYLTPMDSDSKALLWLVEGEGTKQMQVQLLDDKSLQLAIEPVENLSDYWVVYYYKNTAGEIKCTLPVPLVNEDRE